MDDLKKLTQQFVNAAKQSTGPASSVPEIANYFKDFGGTQLAERGIKAGGALSTQKAQEADAQDAANRAAREAELKKKLDPNNYRLERKADGGFAFFDPDNKEIDINTYSQATGRSRQDVLSSSENPVDQAYLNDYSKMQSALQTIYGGDEAEKEALLQANPELRGVKVQDFAAQLIKKYPHIYGYGGNGKQAYQQTLKNQNQSVFRGGYGAGGGLASLGI